MNATLAADFSPRFFTRKSCLLRMFSHNNLPYSTQAIIKDYQLFKIDDPITSLALPTEVINILRREPYNINTVGDLLLKGLPVQSFYAIGPKRLRAITRALNYHSDRTIASVRPLLESITENDYEAVDNLLKFTLRKQGIEASNVNLTLIKVFDFAEAHPEAVLHFTEKE